LFHGIAELGEALTQKPPVAFTLGLFRRTGRDGDGDGAGGGEERKSKEEDEEQGAGRGSKRVPVV